MTEHENNLFNIAESIRSVKNITGKILASDFENEIKTIVTMLSYNGIYIDDFIKYITGNLSCLTSLPEGITSIGADAFRECTSLALTSLPEGITSIGADAFRDCTSLALTSLPEGITSIGAGAFSGCTSLALTSLPEGITSIDSLAFKGCTNLTSMTIGGPGKPMLDGGISTSSFNGCTNLTSITIYTEGGVSLTNSPFGATNATITYIDSNA